MSKPENEPYWSFNLNRLREFPELVARTGTKNKTKATNRTKPKKRK